MADRFERAAVRTPRQRRSEASFERMLGATRKLLENHSFSEISIQQIVAAAGCSVGAFYARFENKEALLDCLDELYARDLIAEFQARAREWERSRPTLEELVGQAADFLVAFHRERRGVVRALILHARLHPGGPFGERTRRMQAQTPGIVRVFAYHRQQVAHPEPGRAIRFALVQALTTVREYVLHPEGPAAAAPMSDDEVAGEVARSWLHYLNPPGEQR